jgi:autotransporter-associated beta strand protein
MKNLPKRSLKLISAGLGLAACLLAYNANAANSNFLPSGGVVTGTTYPWDLSTTVEWSTATTGSPNETWQQAVVNSAFPRFSLVAGKTITLTVTGDLPMAGLWSYGTITINGSGAGNDLNVQGAGGVANIQGILMSTSTCTINCPMVGTGGIQPNLIAGACSLYLYGANTYSGGTLLTSSGLYVYINSSSSFGTGPIYLQETAGYYCPLFISSGTITIPNSIQWSGTAATTMGGINVASGGSAIFSGTVTGGAAGNPVEFRNNNTGASGYTVTISGVIGDTGGGLVASSQNGTSIYLSGANTYTGPTQIGDNQTAITLVISGSGTLGNTGAGTGSYAGAIVNNATGGGGFTYNSSSAQTLSGLISGVGALKMTGAGSLVLSHANTYSGATTVSAGTLEISGSIAGSLNVTSTGGTLQLDNASALAPATVLTLASTPADGAVNLNFTGTQYISALKYGTATQANGTYGSLTSSAQYKSATFTGNGILAVISAPLIVTQPQPTSVWPGGNATFSVVALGPALTYQWSLNGTSLGSSATASSYTVTGATSANAGDYTCVIANGNLPNATTTAAHLTVLTPNAYNSAVLTDTPLAYWRLDEASGTTAYDYVGGNNGTYNNAVLNQTPGYSAIDSDACVGLQKMPLGQGSFVSVANYNAFNFFKAQSSFTLEGWVYVTNLTGVQRLFSTDANLAGLGGYMFGINGANGLIFTTSGWFDYPVTLSSPLQPNVWYQIAFGYDATTSTMHYYVNGQPVATRTKGDQGTDNGGTNGAPMCLGANGDYLTSNGGTRDNSEQLQGSLDECAIYGTFLGDYEIQQHYNAALPPAPVAQTPTADQPTNYVSLTTTLTESAVGQSLHYQWYQNGSPVGSDNSTLTLPNLALGDAGTYTVHVYNDGGSTNPPGVVVTVRDIPKTPEQVGLTNGLVLHLPFDGNYNDISGRNNNGTATGAPALNTDTPVVGNGYLTCSSTVGGPYNYVTLGKPSDLVFGQSGNFTVAFWVRQAYANIGTTNLPFFCNDTNGLSRNLGFAIGPTLTSLNAPNGGFGWTMFDGTTAQLYNSAASAISDGNWHQVVCVFDRGSSATTYLDGQFVDARNDSYFGGVDSGLVFNICQDATGMFDSSSTADIDDLGVWKRALAQFEVSGMYLAGARNTPGVSFAPVVTAANPVKLQVVQNGTQWQIVWTGGGTLQSSGQVQNGVNTGFTDVAPTATSPYTIPMTGPQLFYRLKY